MPRAYRSGVRFSCNECGKLLKDCTKHAPVIKKACPDCAGNLKLVAVGEEAWMVGDAIWFRCVKCKALYMRRRGELVPAGHPRTGFKSFTEF